MKLVAVLRAGQRCTRDSDDEADDAQRAEAATHVWSEARDMHRWQDLPQHHAVNRVTELDVPVPAVQPACDIVFGLITFRVRCA